MGFLPAAAAAIQIRLGREHPLSLTVTCVCFSALCSPVQYCTAVFVLFSSWIFKLVHSGQLVSATQLNAS